MPKYIQQTLAWIFAAFFVAAFFFFAHRVHGGSSSVSDVSLMIVTCVAGIQMVALCCMEGYGGTLLEKLAKSRHTRRRYRVHPLRSAMQALNRR